jgi:hypothetical protein
VREGEYELTGDEESAEKAVADARMADKMAIVEQAMQ